MQVDRIRDCGSLGVTRLMMLGEPGAIEQIAERIGRVVRERMGARELEPTAKVS